MFRIKEGENKPRMSKQEGARRRQIVYATILGNPDKKFTAKELAIAAGWDCSDINTKEYKNGMAFIDNMQRSGYVQHDIPTSKEGNIWYVCGKEKVECEHLLKDTHIAEDKIGGQEEKHTLTLTREVPINEESKTEEVEVKVNKTSKPEVKKEEPKKFDIILTIYQHGVEDPNNIHLELEGKTNNEIVDTVRAITAIL